MFPDVQRLSLVFDSKQVAKTSNTQTSNGWDFEVFRENQKLSKCLKNLATCLIHNTWVGYVFFQSSAVLFCSYFYFSFQYLAVYSTSIKHLSKLEKETKAPHILREFYPSGASFWWFQQFLVGVYQNISF